jgi:AAA domain
VAYTADLEAALKDLTEGTSIRFPWAHYCDAAARSDSNQEIHGRSYVHQKSGGLVRYPAKNSFSSVTEARVMLYIGISIEYRQAPLNSPRHQWPGTEKNELYLNQQTQAPKRLFETNVQQSTKDRWWPVGFNQRPDRLPIMFPAVSLGVDADRVKSEMAHVLDSFPWSQEQQAALVGSQKFHGPVQVLQGPPGSGKTQLLAGKSLFFALTGFSVLVCGPTPAVAKAFMKSWKNWVPQRTKMVRFSSSG